MIEKWTSGQPGGLRTDVKGENAVVTPRVKYAANGNYTLKCKYSSEMWKAQQMADTL